jgi:hypothetical protein
VRGAGRVRSWPPSSRYQVMYQTHSLGHRAPWEALRLTMSAPNPALAVPQHMYSMGRWCIGRSDLQMFTAWLI